MTFRFEPKLHFRFKEGIKIARGRVKRRIIRMGNFSYLVAMEPEDEGGLLEAVVDLAGQVEHAADVDKHLAVAQDPRRWHCKEKKVSFVLLQSKESGRGLFNCQSLSDNRRLNATKFSRKIESSHYFILLKSGTTQNTQNTQSNRAVAMPQYI